MLLILLFYQQDECFYYGNFDLGLTLLRQAADEDHLKAMDDIKIILYTEHFYFDYSFLVSINYTHNTLLLKLYY